jgi:hypothetical protein
MGYKAGPRQTFLSFIAASCAAALTLFLLAIGLFLLGQEPESLSHPHTWAFLIPFVFISFLFACLTSVVLGFPLYVLVRRGGWDNVATILIGGTVIGCLVVPATWHWLIGPTKIEWYLYFSGSLIGSVSSMIFWIAQRRR